MGKKKADSIKAEFSSPYLQFMPTRDSSRLDKLQTNDLSVDNWKLKPKSGKRKERETDMLQTTEPPQKRSRTDLHDGVSNHVRFDEEGEVVAEEKYEKTEDDKKALPQDMEIPIKFLVPTKKKKKNRNKDVDILDAVQKHLSNIRKIQEENDRALGENPGDEQPIELREHGKTNKGKKMKREKGSKQEQSNQSRSSKLINQSELKILDQSSPELLDQSGPIVIDNSDSDSGEVKVIVSLETNNKDTNIGERTNSEEKEQSGVITIGSSDEEPSKQDDKPKFKPYDYTKGAKQLLEGNSQPKKGSRYYNPIVQMMKGKGSKSSKNKGNMKQGGKSFTFKR